MKYDLTVSIVLYKTDPLVLTQVIESVFSTSLTFKLYLIDNSPTDSLKEFERGERITYVFNNRNLGFGKAHNLAMKRAVAESKYHLVLNPDVSFTGDVLDKLFTFMESNPQVGQVMPKVLYPSGEIQYLCKLLPAPADLFLRRFFPWLPGAAQRNEKYELRRSGYHRTMNVPYLSGCFMFLRTKALQKVGYFDEAIFMYIEDADLTRRIHRFYETIYYPDVSICHHYAKGSYKNIKLMLYNIHGAIIYFSKWGWFIDTERNRINKQTIRQYLK